MDEVVFFRCSKVLAQLQEFRCSANMFWKIKTVCLHNVISEISSFPMRPAKHYCEKPLPNYVDPKTVLIYCPHPVFSDQKINREKFFKLKSKFGELVSCDKKNADII